MELEYQQFEDRLRLQARKQRQPLYCLFELTPTCNLRCRFCYVALDPYKGPYLSTEEVCRILDVVERSGVLWLTLTGGEIFSRRDFPEIYRYAKEKGFLVMLFSNATMVTEQIAALLREHPPFSVEVSIYGADAAHYEATTQIPGSFARFERGLTRLIDAGVPLVLKSPISKLTEDHLPALYAYAQARNIKFKVDLTIDNRHDGGQQPSLYRITPRNVMQLGDQVLELNGLQRPDPLPACSDHAPPSGPEELYRCGAGRTGYFIDGLGNVSHCVIDRDPTFPILEMAWEEIWARMGEWVTQPLPSDAPCSGCTIRHSCGNCPARSRLATRSPYLKDTYYCDLNHLHHGLEPVEHPDYQTLARPLGACAV